MDVMLKRYLNQEVLYRPLVGVDGAGVPIYGTYVEDINGSGLVLDTTPKTLKGYVTGKVMLMLDEQGAQRYSKEVIYFDEEVAAFLKEGDELTPPDGRAYIIQKLRKFYRRAGPLDYVEVFL